MRYHDLHCIVVQRHKQVGFFLRSDLHPFPQSSFISLALPGSSSLLRVTHLYIILARQLIYFLRERQRHVFFKQAIDAVAPGRYRQPGIDD